MTTEELIEHLENKGYAMVSASKKGLTDENNLSRHRSAKKWLDENDIHYMEAEGLWEGETELSLLLLEDSIMAVLLGKRFQQDTVLSSGHGIIDLKNNMIVCDIVKVDYRLILGAPGYTKVYTDDGEVYITVETKDRKSIDGSTSGSTDRVV